MRTITAPLLLVGLASALVQSGCVDRADAAGGSTAQANSASSSDVFVSWPLPADEQAYGTIDGRRIWQYVEEQAEISRRHRDEINPQFWGRISGTPSDVWSAEWLLDKYRQIGLTETRIQDVARFLPQWVPESWEVTATAAGNTITLTSAQPPYGAASTDGRVLDLPAVWVGLGTEADFAGRDVRGKAVFLMGGRGCEGGTGDGDTRAQDRGAAAVFNIGCHGGNFRYQDYRPSTTVPTFDVGTQDGAAVREMIEKAPAGSPPRIRLRLDAEWVNGQKSFLVWGTLPGATDETIYVVAHRDGWFDAAGDNATGVAAMLGLAEYFAQVPQSERRRTMVFIGMDGHHEIRPGWYGAIWLVANRERFFSQTALFINMEHPSQVLTYGGNDGRTETIIPLAWYAGGPSRPELGKIAYDAFHKFGVPIWAQQSERAPGGEGAPFFWFLPTVVAQSNDFFYFHTDGDSPETISWAGLEAATRAHAKIIDEVNQLELSDLQAPPEQDPNAPGAPRQALDIRNCAEWVKDSTMGCDEPGYLTFEELLKLN